jgi:hypothetical protein
MSQVSSLSTSRSGRKLHKPCEFWRQQVPVYEGCGGDRHLVARARARENESESEREKERERQWEGGGGGRGSCKV